MNKVEPNNKIESNEDVKASMIRYKCATCGNTCLQETPPNNNTCGGCDLPNWKILKIQEAYMTNQNDWIHPNGEI